MSTLDFEEKHFYNITVIAYDKGNPSLSSSAKLWVTVADTPDSVPDFTKAVYTVEVAENSKPGDIIYKLDAGEGPFKYSLLSKFALLSVHSITNLFFVFNFVRWPRSGFVLGGQEQWQSETSQTIGQ